MIFTIKEGKHTSWPRFPIPIFTNKLSFNITFNESAKYDPILNDYDHSYDVNKAFGFMEGLDDSNGARLGWSYTAGKLILYPYVHVDGEVWMKSSIPPICTAEINETIPVTIENLQGKYIYTVRNNIAFAPAHKQARIKFLHFPYFGGPNPAPHTIKIKITT